MATTMNRYQYQSRAIGCWLTLVAIGGCGQPKARADDKTIADQLRPFVVAHSLAGAVVLVADRERVLDVEAVGYANIAANRPMTVDALFWVASEAKPITATALMMLVDEGKVRLDDPVAQYLPEFNPIQVATGRGTPRRPRRPVTVRDILTHTSGLPFSSAVEQPTLDVLPLRDAVRSYPLAPLQFEPGTRFQYANAGINTAGRIIEVVSGQPYETFLQTRLFDPLGMKDTTFRPTAAQVERLATSYKPDASKTGLQPTTIGQLRYPLDDPGRHPFPAGGLFSTAADLAQFARMILNDGTLDGHRYLSAESVAAMTRNQTPPAAKASYGLGWFADADGTEFGHGGAYATDLAINRPLGLTFIFMVQHAGFPNDGEQARAVFRQAATARFAPPRK